MTSVRCPSCNAPFMDKPSEVRTVCIHCGTAFMYDAVGSHVPEYAVARLSDTEAVERVHNWSSGVKGGREFSRHLELAKMTLRYFPLYVYGKTKAGESVSVVSSAVPSMQPGIRIIDATSTELRKLSAETDISDFTMPQTEPEAYSPLLSVDASSRKLVFYPFWLTQYVYRGKLNTVTVDACTGRVSGDLSVEIEKRSSLPLAAGGFAAISAEGAIAYFGYIYAVAAIAVTVFALILYSFRRKD